MLSLVSDGPFRHASTSMAASTSVALAVSWVAQKVRILIRLLRPTGTVHRGGTALGF